MKTSSDRLKDEWPKIVAYLKSRDSLPNSVVIGKWKSDLMTANGVIQQLEKVKNNPPNPPEEITLS